MDEKNNVANTENQIQDAENYVNPYSQHHSSHHSSSGKHSHKSSHKSSHHSSSKLSSHHHSSSKKSSHKSSRRSSKKVRSEREKIKRYKRWRTVFSFLLFLSIAATSILAGLKFSALNETRVVDIFTNYEYINSLREDVLEYAQDLCMKCAIPESAVKDTISYENISNVEIAYIHGNLCDDEMYSESTYVDIIGKINNELVTSINAAVSDNNLKVERSQSTEGVKKLADGITEYLTKKVEFRYVSDIQSIINVSNTAINIGLVLFVILFVAFLLLTLSLTDKRYRALRSVSYSVFAASLLNFLLVAFVGIVDIFKDLLIYPEYFCNSVLRFIHICLSTFALEGALLFIIGLAVAAVTWRTKRNND